jgi:hypothetical protein
MAVRARKGKFPHIEWLDLKGDGLMTECAIMKKDPLGNISYFELNKIDAIDKQRVARLVQSRNAENFELWDLMSQTTLNNGVNALTYFHQLVKVNSEDGVIYTPKGGVVGMGTAPGTYQDPMLDANPSVAENK